MLSFCVTYSPLFCALYTHVHFLVQAIRTSRVINAEIVVLFCRVGLFLCYLFVVEYILISLLIKENFAEFCGVHVLVLCRHYMVQE
jgi:hypothetical protein